MISTRTSASALLVAGLLAATTVLAGCDLLPFGQTPAAPAPGAAPSAAEPAAQTSAVASVASTSQAPITASIGATATATDQTEVPDVTGLDAKAAQDALKQARLDYILSWSGDAMGASRRVVSQQPPAGATVTSGTRVTILAATGKGEGRPFPITYYSTTDENEFGLRCSGTTTTQQFPAREGSYIIAVSTMNLPLKIWLIDEEGNHIKLCETFKSHGKWYQRFWVLKVLSDDEERDYRDFQIEVETSNSTWWDVRYGVFAPGDIPTLDALLDSGTGAGGGTGEGGS